MASLMVCIPTFDGSVKSRTAESVGNAIDHAEDAGLLDRVVHRYPGGYDVARARNFMARWALEEKVDYLLMVDSDMVLPRDAISCLMRDDVDVALGFAVRGTSDAGDTAIVKSWSHDNSDTFSTDDFRKLREDGTDVVEVRRGGMACALVKTRVFGRVKKPWFYYQENGDGSALSEDFWFCRQCQNAGVKVFVDARVGCGHIKERTLEAM